MVLAHILRRAELRGDQSASPTVPHPVPTAPPQVMQAEAPAFLPAPPGAAAVHDGGGDDEGDPPDHDGG